jgi:hypothetical protein
MSNTTMAMTIENTMNGTCVNLPVVDNNHYSQFEIFYIFFIMLMPLSKKYAPLIKSDVVRRKINQYTNWNLLMIL